MDALTAELEEKRNSLLACIQPLERVLVAVSGGVDSAVLFKAAHLALGAENALGVTVSGNIFASHEMNIARALAHDHGMTLDVVNLTPIDEAKFRANPPDRCYHCKRFLFEHLIEYARAKGIVHLLEGSNVDDLRDFRPGAKAVEELSLHSPLQAAGFTKIDIRALARHWGLMNWDAPSAACLASRIPYGVEIRPEMLKRVDEAERFLRDRFGLRQFRVRYDGSTARIEAPEEAIELLAAPEARREIVETLRGQGFQFVALDLQGYRMGSLNEIL